MKTGACHSISSTSLETRKPEGHGRRLGEVGIVISSTRNVKRRRFSAKEPERSVLFSSGLGGVKDPGVCTNSLHSLEENKIMTAFEWQWKGGCISKLFGTGSASRLGQ